MLKPDSTQQGSIRGIVGYYLDVHSMVNKSEVMMEEQDYDVNEDLIID